MKDIEISKTLCRFQKNKAVILYDKKTGELQITTDDFGFYESIYDLHEALGFAVKYLKNEEC